MKPETQQALPMKPGDSHPIGLTTELAQVLYPIVIENLKLLDRKQRDYGPNNLTKFGTFGVMVRANDKLERIVNLMKLSEGAISSGARAELNEPLADSFLDLANYALIAYVMHTGKWPVQK